MKIEQRQELSIGGPSGLMQQTMSRAQFCAMRAQILQAQYQRGEMAAVIETQREINQEDIDDLTYLSEADPGAKEFIHGIIYSRDMGWR